MSLHPVAIFTISTSLGYFTFDQIQKYRMNHRRVIQQRLVKDRVFMDFNIGEEYAGRVIFGLYSDHVPLTCENFIQLCKGYRDEKKALSYRGTQVHKINPHRYIVLGDTLSGAGASLGMSIYGKRFPHENFSMSFTQDGDLAMYSEGFNTNASQFMVTLRPMPRLQGQYTCFGTVLQGMKVIRRINDQATKMGRLVRPVYVVNCGLYDELNPEPAPLLKDAAVTEQEFRQTIYSNSY
jgi:peptidylprolyl isomerase